MNRQPSRWKPVDWEAFLLLRVSRSVLLQYQSDYGTHLLVSITTKVCSFHFGVVRGSFRVVHSVSLLMNDNPDLSALHDGHGFNLDVLHKLIKELL